MNEITEREEADEISGSRHDRLVKWLIISLDQFRSGNQFTESSWGRFRVNYNTGGRSAPMGYGTAKSYAAIFGGTIQHIATGQVLGHYDAI